MISGSASYLAFSLAYEANYARVLDFAYQYAPSFDTAEDFAGMAWENAAKGWDHFDGANLLGWMRTIVKSVVSGYYRVPKNAILTSLDEYSETHAVPELSVQDDLDLLIEYMEPDGPVFKAFHSLPEGLKTVLACRLRQEEPSQAAARLNLDYRAYRFRLYRARQMMKQLLLECCPNLVSRRNTPCCG